MIESPLLEPDDPGTSVARSERRAALLWKSAQVLLTANDANEMVRTLFHEIREDLGVDAYFNFLVEENQPRLRLASCEGIPQEEIARIQRLDFGEAICGRVAAQRAPIVVADIQHSGDPQVQLVKEYGIRAYACNPLLCGDRLLGTLSFATRARDSFEDDELEVLRSISHYVALAYDRLSLIARLRDAERRKDEFLATLAHELRNPLDPIRMSAELMRLKYPGDADMRSAGETIDHQVSVMARLVDDLLDVARLTLGRVELRIERIALGGVLAQAIATARPVVESFGQELSLELSADPMYVDADATRLAQVFVNLLNNAAKYTPRGGRICLSACAQQASAVIRVTDNGIGIPRSMLPRVFDLFRQVDTEPTREQSGLGIGLTIARRLVLLHGGRIEAHSAGRDRGSEFVVTLPVVAAPRQARKVAPAASTVPSRSIRILIIDDNEHVAKSLAGLTRLHGHHVHVANGGERGIELAREIQPELIFLDIGMPGMDGYETCRRLRREPSCSGTTIIALTGWGQDIDRERSRSAGFDHFWVKPIDSQMLTKLPTTLRPR